MARQSPDTFPQPRPMTPLACDLKLVDTAHDSATISGRIESDHLSGQKRKAGPGELATKSSNKFKVLGQLVIAMKRFQGALNPIVTFGKRAASSSGSLGEVWARHTPADSEEASSVPTLPRPASESDFVSAPEAGLAFPRRGHRADYLVAPLPPLPSPCRARSPAAQHLPS